MALFQPVTAIILDIGDVLCSWKPASELPIQPKLLKEFRTSSIWQEYNCGRISQNECYSRLAAQYGVALDDITTAFDLARASQGQNDEVVAFIQELKQVHADLRVYAMSNISAPDWKILRAKPFNWEIFDHVFTSCESGMCKPELRFYRHVLAQAGLEPSQVVFVDDKAENVLAAKSVGFRDGIVFEKAEDVRRRLLALLMDPVERGRQWLRSQAGQLYSETSTGVVVPDNFGQLMLHELMNDTSLINLRPFDRTWNYFIGTPFGTCQNYPDDVDTTSYALKTLGSSPMVAQSVMDEMVSPAMTTADGIVTVYFGEGRERTDPTVCINVVRCFYAYQRGQDPGLTATKEWIWEVLLHRAYADGTRYYHQPDVFLYFFARLLAENPGSDLHRDGAGLRLLSIRLRERINAATDPMGLAMRVLACHFAGLGPQVEGDLSRLLAAQQVDGSFEIGWLCQYGKTGIKLGHRGLTTALAITAVQAMRDPLSFGLRRTPLAVADLGSNKSREALEPARDNLAIVTDPLSAEPLSAEPPPGIVA